MPDHTEEKSKSRIHLHVDGDSPELKVTPDAARVLELKEDGTTQALPLHAVPSTQPSAASPHRSGRNTSHEAASLGPPPTGIMTTDNYIRQAHARGEQVIESEYRGGWWRTLVVLFWVAFVYFSLCLLIPSGPFITALTGITPGMALAAILVLVLTVFGLLMIVVDGPSGVTLNAHTHTLQRWYECQGITFSDYCHVPMPRAPFTLELSATPTHIKNTYIHSIRFKNTDIELYKSVDGNKARATFETISKYLGLKIVPQNSTKPPIPPAPPKPSPAPHKPAALTPTQMLLDEDDHEFSSARDTKLVHKPWSASSPESEKLIQKFAEAEANIPDTYEILGMLGEGGMATVFQVKDKRTKQIYALKVLAPQLVQDDASTKRFEQEAHATERLINPSIARVHESGMGKLGAPYLVMDFVPGENLAELLKIRTRLSPRHALRLFIQIADAIFYAHSMGVVHRDIKPSNIIVHYDETRVKGKRASACLVDFGIAKMRLDNQATHGLTRTGEIFGSPQYMSPEQCEGAELDVRSDIYSFGCVMYETITGKPPFQSENPIELILKHLQEEPEPITEVGVGANAEELNYVTMRCLQKDPKERYQTMIEVEAALKDCLLRGHVARTVSLDHSHSSPGKSKTGRVDQSDNHQEEEICSVCGKPIAGLAQSNVTRYLSWESRCQCNTSDDEFLGDKTQFLDPAEVSDPVTKEQLSVAAANLPDQYEVLELIGQGGMGAVFKVRDKRLDKTFAVKMLRPQMANNAEAQARFQTEARAVSALTHVNLAAVFDYGVGKHGAPYLVMEYLDGDTLGKIIRTEDCIAVPRAVDLFIQVGEAISHAHEKGVIHRDLKPSNIIVEHSDSGTEIAKLVDFGIAKTMAAGASRNTQTGDVLGSPPYMSPEQCLGKKLDARSDIYAFGCVMYEALCGRPPFSGRNQIQIIVRHVKDAPAELSASCTVQPIPDDLNYIVMRCLSKEPGNRYQRMTELLHDLQNFRDNKPITHVPIAKELSKASIGATFLKLLWPFGH